jgi:hypothetical protein
VIVQLRRVVAEHRLDADEEPGDGPAVTQP